MKTEQRAFLMYVDRLDEYAEDLNDEELGKWLRAILLFQKTGEITSDTGERVLDADIRKYCKILAENKANWLTGQESRSNTQKENAEKKRAAAKAAAETGKPRPMKTRKPRAQKTALEAAQSVIEHLPTTNQETGSSSGTLARSDIETELDRAEAGYQEAGRALRAFIEANPEASYQELQPYRAAIEDTDTRRRLAKEALKEYDKAHQDAKITEEEREQYMEQIRRTLNRERK